MASLSLLELVGSAGECLVQPERLDDLAHKQGVLDVELAQAGPTPEKL